MFWQLVLKDLKIFFADRRSLIISMLVPICIASFMAMIFGSTGSSAKEVRIPLLVVDEDASATSTKAIDNLTKSPNLSVSIVTKEKAYGDVKVGKAAIALVIPKGFGDDAAISMAPDSNHTRASITFVTDPSQSTAVQAARGLVVQPIMQAVFGGGPDMKLPFDIYEEPLSASADTSGVAHVFAGMSVQGLLFFSIEAAMGVMRERKLGIWKRIRAAPVSPLQLLLARIFSGSIRAFGILVAVFGFGMLVFHLRVMGSWPGLILVGVAASIMAAAFGLFVSALGRNEQQSRGLAIFVVLTMTMLGGAWFPSFLMPGWVQKVAMAIPVKWAVDGFDAVTWRAGDLGSVLTSVVVLLGFAVAFALIAVTRFRWDAEGA